MFQIVTLFASGIIVCSMVLIFIRIIKGPDLVDRIVATDIFSANLIGLLILYSLISDNLVYLDIALVISLIAFLGTMAFAYFLIKE
jgi:multicomponent Na+:H+ antiporter subunit F